MSQHYVILQVFQEVGSIHGRNEKAVRPQILLNWSVDTYDINYIITYSSILKEKTVNV